VVSFSVRGLLSCNLSGIFQLRCFLLRFFILTTSELVSFLGVCWRVPSSPCLRFPLFLVSNHFFFFWRSRFLFSLLALICFAAGALTTFFFCVYILQLSNGVLWCLSFKFTNTRPISAGTRCTSHVVCKHFYYSEFLQCRRFTSRVDFSVLQTLRCTSHSPAPHAPPVTSFFVFFQFVCLVHFVQFCFVLLHVRVICNV